MTRMFRLWLTATEEKSQKQKLTNSFQRNIDNYILVKERTKVAGLWFFLLIHYLAFLILP
jgi:hypothetical protein